MEFWIRVTLLKTKHVQPRFNSTSVAIHELVYFVENFTSNIVRCDNKYDLFFMLDTMIFIIKNNIMNVSINNDWIFKWMWCFTKYINNLSSLEKLYIVKFMVWSDIEINELTRQFIKKFLINIVDDVEYYMVLLSKIPSILKECRELQKKRRHAVLDFKNSIFYKFLVQESIKNNYYQYSSILSRDIYISEINKILNEIHN